MADLVRLAYYPFLSGVREAVQEQGPRVDDLLTGALYRDIRRRATERVRKVLGDGDLTPPAVVGDQAALDELLTHAVVRMLLVSLGDRHLAGRYASREAARARHSLHDDSREGFLDCLRGLEVPVETDCEPWRIHFGDYLQNAPHRQEWKLVLQTVDHGWIDVDRRLAETLAEEAYRRRLEAGLLEELKTPVPADLKAALQPYLDELGPELAEARKDWNTGDFGPVREGAFPPCIVQLFEQMKAGAMIPHHGRFAFASFLANIGMTADQILDHLAQTPNFNRDASEYQIRHIAGEMGVEGYTPPGCDAMQTHGVCPLEMRDDICFSVKHPLNYYRKKLRRMPEPIEDETEGKEAGAETDDGKDKAEVAAE